MRRDRAVGLMLAATGAVIGLAAAKYERGVLRNIGPGFFPILIASVLAGLGLLVAIRHADGRFESTAADQSLVRLAAVPFAIVAFALLVESAGVPLAAMALVITSSCARAGGRWRDVALLALALSLLAVVIFVWALGVPLSVLPQPLGWP
jgi:putative tricarboxylic transport membrane protein